MKTRPSALSGAYWETVSAVGRTDSTINVFGIHTTSEGARGCVTIMARICGKVQSGTLRSGGEVEIPFVRGQYSVCADCAEWACSSGPGIPCGPHWKQRLAIVQHNLFCISNIQWEPRRNTRKISIAISGARSAFEKPAMQRGNTDVTFRSMGPGVP